jgi:hypothetical protein
MNRRVARLVNGKETKPMPDDKTPDPKKPGGAQDPNTMGGPSFHPQPAAPPESDKTEKAGKKEDGILSDDQIPAVTPPDKG